MSHAKFEFIASQLCLDFCNTTNYAMPAPNERLKTYGDLIVWGEMAGVLDEDQAGALAAWGESHPREALEALEEARAIRMALHRLFGGLAHGKGPLADDLHTLNEALSKVLPHQRIGLDERGFTLGWEPALAPDRMMWLVVGDAVGVLISDQLQYVRQCSGTGCSWLFMDQTRNHRRRWCSMDVCGNRAKVKRHYQRSRT